MEFTSYFALAMIGLLVLIFTWFVVLIIGRSIGFIVRRLTKNHPDSAHLTAKAIKLGYIGAIAFFAYETYDAIYPSDSFYLGEFELVTDRKPPIETRVLFKDATYPDFHGDYCSFSRIKVSPQSYNGLIKELNADARFIGSDSKYISVGFFRNSKLPPMRVTRTFERRDLEPDHHYEISFLENNTHLEVRACVT